MVLSSKLASQNQLPNSNFEDWTTAVNGTDSLKNWSSTNAVVLYPVKSLYLNRDTPTANNRVLLATAPFGFVQWNVAGILVNGKAIFSYDGGGGILRGGTRYVSGGGSPISLKIKSLNGKYKYQLVSVNSDRGVVEVTTTKYNVQKKKRDTVGIGKGYFPLRDVFSDFTVEINDLQPTIIPDSITTIFYSSDLETMPMQNTFSSLYLDDLKLTTITRVEEVDLTDIKVFPNPNNGHFSLQLTSTLSVNDVVVIHNIVGQKIQEIPININQNSVNIKMSHLENGIYFIQSKSNSFKRKTFIVVK